MVVGDARKRNRLPIGRAFHLSGVERIRQILGKIPFDTHSLSPTPLTHMGGIWNVVISSLGARLLITLSPTRKAKR